MFTLANTSVIGRIGKPPRKVNTWKISKRMMDMYEYLVTHGHTPERAVLRIDLFIEKNNLRRQRIIIDKLLKEHSK